MVGTRKSLKSVVIRFAGDSGDGIQLSGGQFTKAVAHSGSDITTFPDFPAEIRAPVGTLAGVSGFQLHFANEKIYTSGDMADVLIAQNPAALKASLAELKRGGILIVNTGTFSDVNLKKAGYINNPLQDDFLSNFKVIKADMNHLVQKALSDTSLSTKEKLRCRNFWSLGLLYWLFDQDINKQIQWIKQKFVGKTAVIKANTMAFKAGYIYGEACELFQENYQVDKAPLAKGVHRYISGNQALSLGLITAAHKANLSLFLGSYPITPASDILHELSQKKQYGVITYQAEDEIAAIGAAIGASYGGSLGVATTSGPGLALKSEALGLAVMLELPLVVVNVQRAGPSTGMPTKTEQSDLNQALFGRSGEAPMPVLAPCSVEDCFEVAIVAARIAIKYMTPVIILSDGNIANSAQSWLVPNVDKIKPIEVKFRKNPQEYFPYQRNEKTLARDWVIPGTSLLEHTIGGLEKDKKTGEVSYDGANHEYMVRVRQQKIDNIVNDIKGYLFEGEECGDILLVGWGSSYGALKHATIELNKQNITAGHLHLRCLNPLDGNIEKHLLKFNKVLVCENNLGQLCNLLRAKFLVDAKRYNKIQGRPFKISEIVQAVKDIK